MAAPWLVPSTMRSWDDNDGDCMVRPLLASSFARVSMIYLIHHYIYTDRSRSRTVCSQCSCHNNMTGHCIDRQWLRPIRNSCDLQPQRLDIRTGLFAEKQTETRKIVNGWKPPASISAPSIVLNPRAHTKAHGPPTGVISSIRYAHQTPKGGREFRHSKNYN